MSLHWTDDDLARYVAKGRAAPAPAPSYSEKAFMAAVVRVAKQQGWILWHAYSAKKSVPGYPDLTMAKACHGTQGQGRLLFAELKTDTGHLTAAQQEWITTLQSIAGVECYVWRPADWPAIVTTLTAPERPHTDPRA